MKKNTVNKTAFTSKGYGKPIIFIHGLGLNKKMWDLQVPALVNNYLIITYDLLGHGETNDQCKSFSIDIFVNQLRNLVKFLGISEFGLIGFSLGGIIAREYAIHHPESVKALSIINSPYNRSKKERNDVMLRVHKAEEGGPAATVDDAIKRWFTNDFILSGNSIVNQVRDWILSNNPEIYHKIYKVFANSDINLRNSISLIKCPSLVIACALDVGSSPKMAKNMANAIASSKLEILPDLKHMGVLEKPEIINILLKEFFKFYLK